MKVDHMIFGWTIKPNAYHTNVFHILQPQTLFCKNVLFSFSWLLLADKLLRNRDDKHTVKELLTCDERDKWSFLHTPWLHMNQPWIHWPPSGIFWQIKQNCSYSTLYYASDQLLSVVFSGDSKAESFIAYHFHLSYMSILFIYLYIFCQEMAFLSHVLSSAVAGRKQ